MIKYTDKQKLGAVKAYGQATGGLRATAKAQGVGVDSLSNCECCTAHPEDMNALPHQLRCKPLDSRGQRTDASQYGVAVSLPGHSSLKPGCTGS